jgi:hypothetical protein
MENDVIRLVSAFTLFAIFIFSAYLLPFASLICSLSSFVICYDEFQCLLNVLLFVVGLTRILVRRLQ